MPFAVRPARLVVAVAAALLVAYIVMWSQVTATGIGRSDFTSTYVGATLLREGHRADLYSEPLQARLHSQLIAPDREGNLPFVNAPLAALLATPVTLLGLDAAFWLWGSLQLLVLTAAVVVAVRAAPWSARVSTEWKVAAALTGLAGAGTLVLVVQAQWTSVSALGLALAYRAWRNDQLGRGAALLILSAGIAKPHLALGLVAFMLGWRNRQVLKGAAFGLVATLALSVAVVGTDGASGFVHALTSTLTRWDLDSFVSFVGLSGVAFGNSGAAQALGLAGSLAACGLAFWLGGCVRSERRHLEPALAGAAVLSLLAAPHALLHDVALLAPVMAWSVPFTLQHAPQAVTWTANRFNPRLTVALGCWALVTAAVLVSLSAGAGAAQARVLAPGALVVSALVLCAAIAVFGTRREPQLTQLPPKPSATSRVLKRFKSLVET